MKKGIELPAPNFVVESPATLLAISKHSFIFFPLNIANEKPPLNASPAPVVSTRFSIISAFIFIILRHLNTVNLSHLMLLLLF